MTDYLQVEGHADLLRDNKSKAIINRNRNAYENAKIKYDLTEKIFLKK